MTLTILAVKKQTSIDIIVKPEQRIKEVVKVLTSNFKLPLELSLGNARIYSRRQKRYINDMLTFKQAQLYTGDILEVTSEQTFGGQESE